MCDACVGLGHRVSELEKRLSSPAHWPAWFAEFEAGLKVLTAACEHHGVTLEQFYENNPGHRANEARDKVITYMLGQPGWTAARVALISRTSERAIRKVLERVRRAGLGEKGKGGKGE